MSSSFAQIRIGLHAAVLGLVLTACATLPPPTGELSAAQQAVARADQADADQYASDAVSAARSELAQAQSAMSSGRYDDARRFALASAADADLAHARSREASLNNELAQRRSEIAELRRRLGMEGDQ